jgi:DNA-binding PadR family transcriptional regulator
MSPVFAHGHLRLYLLSILAEQPMHGYELIQALGNRFGGTYVPSAGTIYPRLGKLQEEGLVTKSTDGRKTIYEITAAGRTELDTRRSELERIENDVTDSVRRLANEVRTSVNDAMKTLRADLASAARDAGDSRRSTQHPEPQRVPIDTQLREAELVISEFRHQLRGDLRSLASQKGLPEGTVTLLKQQLDAVRATVRSLRS